jgi:hypothetical protein
MYFYPPPEGEAKKTLTLDVRVEFHGGWLTEFYPNAGATAPGITLTDQGAAIIGRLEPHAIGSLEWNGLRIGEPVTLPETDDAVWLHPRAVNSAPVSTTDGEGERYLFYRGVANLESPVRAIRRAGMLSIDSPFDVAAMWLVDLRADQSLAYRPVNIRGAAAGFEAAAYHADNPARLRTSMRRALIADGLFADEADAMLNTWEAAYFRTPGLRLFYLVPQTWTDRVLPLRLSVPAKVSRTMVGRIELVTDRQRELLDQIAAGPASESGWMMKLIDGTTMKMPVNTLAELRASGVEKPADFDAYLQLGRFRDALIYDRLKHRPTEALRKFAVNYGIFPYVKVK